MRANRSRGRRVGAAAIALTLGWTGAGSAQSGEAGEPPTPAEYLGFEVGQDRELADWTQITGYLSVLSLASDRVRLDTLGPTTLGRPFVLLTISAPENLARLDEIRSLQHRLADPRLLGGPEEREGAIRSGKNIVLITCSIHSTEVGSSQVPLRIAHRLATSSDADVLEILQNTVVLLVPSLNPDGVDLVVEWYRSSLGTTWEGEGPPFLYHHYVGHDNNRDWYAFTQVETRLAVGKVHNAWHPQIVHDIHQQGRYGSRFFVPPWIDPIEPNVDPLLVASGNALGTEVAWSLLRQGKRGVVLNATYDAWTPARAYQHYHAGVRILSETASAKMATPIDVTPDELEPGRGFDPGERSWNFPAPWEGGTWRLADIVDYMQAGAFALLKHAARNREAWLRNFVAIGERAVGGWPGWPAAWLIPPDGGSGALGGLGEGGGDGAPPATQAWSKLGVAELIRILVTGDVEVERALEPFRAAGRRFSAGTFVVRMSQPYAAFAQTLLETQEYPERQAYEDGPLLTPYDVTAHTLPLLLGVEAVAVDRPPAVAAERVEHASTDSVSAARGRRLARSDRRVALYQPYAPSMDEGWTRWIFDEYELPYATVHNGEVRSGALDGFSAVLIPSITPEVLRDGREAETVPAGFGGGLGEEGAAALGRYVEGGGTLVALDRSVAWVVEELGLPVRDVLEGLEETEYYAPGSLVRIELDRTHPMARRMPEESPAWLQRGSAFEPAQDARVRVVARYADEPILLSGWLQGAEHLAGRPAVVDVPLGAGRVVLFGFRPQYRGQSLVTFPLLFDALHP